LRRPLRPVAALLFVALREVPKDFEKKRPRIPGALPPARWPTPNVSSTPLCGPVKRGTRKAKTNSTMHMPTMIAIVMGTRYPRPVLAQTGPRRGRRRLADLVTVAKQKQIKMQMQVGALAAIPQLESRTDEQLVSESRHRVAAKAILGARAAERYDVDAARAYFNEALAGCHPQERPALRQMMKASMALAERRPDDLKAAMEKLGQEAPSGRQLFMLRMMGLLIPPASAGIVARIRGIVLLILLVIVLLAVGLGIVQLVTLPFGGIGLGSSIFFGFLVVVIALGILVLVGRRRQSRAKEARAAGPAG